ncbi:hypothetical protein ACFW04_000495 [Cataglyphis niger]
MTESGVPRMKRNGTRLFKNPPQPHMCIQDFIQGTTAPCYVNVLSWDKIAMPRKPSLPVPLYGGMRVPPPRTKTEAIVFAVMANPEVLRMSGKNAQDSKRRMIFIELLLDFVEAMNAGVFFNRHYTILKDRDITGELKEVWNAVLAIRDNEQRPPQQETWIDAQPSMSQYPQYSEQQQQQQQQEYTPQPPQYHSSIAYGRPISNENMHYDSYSHQPQNPIITKNEPIFVSGPIMSPKRIQVLSLDPYNYREHGREEQIMQNIITAQHQFQPRQAWPQYVNTKYMHPNSNLSYGSAANTPPVINSPNSIKSFQPYATYQQHQPHMDNAMHVDIRRMQQHPQQPQMHINTVQPQHEQPGTFNVQNNAHRTGRPHMGVVQKNNATKRQNSPMHTSCTSCQTKEDQSFTKPKSPVKVLQRETLTERQDITNHMENNKVSVEKIEEPKTALVIFDRISMTDLNEDLKKDDEVVIADTSTKKEDVDNQERVCTIDDPPLCEEKNSVKLDKPTETKEMEVPAMQKPTVQKNPNKSRSNARTRKMMRDKHNSLVSESPKRSQPTMSIIKSVFKSINSSGSGEETLNKRKANGQTKTANGKATCENEEQGQGYTILKKEAQQEIVSEIAQISIQDCKDTTEVGPVLS